MLLKSGSSGCVYEASALGCLTNHNFKEPSTLQIREQMTPFLFSKHNLYISCILDPKALKVRQS